jgi:predicted metal-binding protein
MNGGEGKVIEIDESKFRKRKYHQGLYVKGQWVYGGVERVSGRTFLVTMRDRSAETLKGLIKQWILPGTTIISDCRAACRSLRDEGYTHFAVNYSIMFVDETTGTHTNMIESMWKQVKALLSPYNRKADCVYFLAECMFRQKCKTEDADPFCKFFQIVATVDGRNTNSTDLQ